MIDLATQQDICGTKQQRDGVIDKLLNTVENSANLQSTIAERLALLEARVRKLEEEQDEK